MFKPPSESRTGQTDPACDGYGCMESVFEKGLRNVGPDKKDKIAEDKEADRTI